MHIKKIRVENARAFGSGDHALDLDFSTTGENLAGWYVFAGPNGSGKSSILQAIALTFNFHLFKIDLPRVLSQRFVHRGKEKLRIEMFFSSNDDEIGDEKRKDVFRFMDWIHIPGKDFRLRKDDLDDFKVVNEASSSEKKGWFISAYGSHRIINLQGLQIREDGWKTKLDSVSNFFAGNHILSEGFNWLRKLHFMALEGTAGARETEQITLSILKDGLLSGPFDGFSITSEGLWAHQGKEKFLLTQLGDGPKSLLSMVIDMMMRLYIAFGDKLKVEYEPTPRVLNSGIVLIDEAENHLHPEWQQRLGFWFKAHFPNIQFLVTTHSPFICQAADHGRLYRVQAQEVPTVKQVSDEDYKRIVNGGPDDAAVSELFGLPHPHSAEAEKDQEELGELEAKAAFGKLTKKDKARLKELEAEQPSTMSADVNRVLRRLVKQHEKTDSDTTLQPSPAVATTTNGRDKASKQPRRKSSQHEKVLEEAPRTQPRKRNTKSA